MESTAIQFTVQNIYVCVHVLRGRGVSSRNAKQPQYVHQLMGGWTERVGGADTILVNRCVTLCRCVCRLHNY